MSVSSLSTFQRGAQRSAFQAAAEKVLREKFKKEDAPLLLRLILHDAATYDADTKTGGFDGSILINRLVPFKTISYDALPGLSCLARSKSATCPLILRVW